jgi:hypothetical protein
MVLSIPGMSDADLLTRAVVYFRLRLKDTQQPGDDLGSGVLASAIEHEEGIEPITSSELAALQAALILIRDESSWLGEWLAAMMRRTATATEVSSRYPTPMEMMDSLNQRAVRFDNIRSLARLRGLHHRPELFGADGVTEEKAGRWRK